MPEVPFISHCKICSHAGYLTRSEPAAHRSNRSHALKRQDRIKEIIAVIPRHKGRGRKRGANAAQLDRSVLDIQA